MERLTKRDTDGQAMMDCEKCKADWTGKHGKPMADCTALYCRNRLLGRLVEYEDTGMTPEEVKIAFTPDALINLAAQALGTTPERLRELAEADKDGRCIIPPCKVGDRLYEVTGLKTISVYKVKAIRLELFGLFIDWDIKEGFVWQSLVGVSAGEIGETVFLSREEAEKALQEME